MAANALVQARIDDDVKKEATAVLAEMGLTVSFDAEVALDYRRDHKTAFSAQKKSG